MILIAPQANAMNLTTFTTVYVSAGPASNSESNHVYKPWRKEVSRAFWETRYEMYSEVYFARPSEF